MTTAVYRPYGLPMTPADNAVRRGGRDGMAAPGRRHADLRDRYSFFVGLMKLVLPVVALCMIATVAVWPSLKFGADDYRVGFLSSLSLTDLENLTLVKARYLGTDEENRPFTVTAEMASQENPKSDLISLIVPAADITLDGGKWVALTAKSGEFYQKDRDLLLKGQVSVFHDDGYSFQTESAKIDLAENSAEGDEPVIGYGPMGRVKAEGFRIVDKGRRVIFTGQSRLIINSTKDGTDTPLKGLTK